MKCNNHNAINTTEWLMPLSHEPMFSTVQLYQAIRQLSQVQVFYQIRAHSNVFINYNKIHIANDTVRICLHWKTANSSVVVFEGSFAVFRIWNLLIFIFFQGFKFCRLRIWNLFFFPGLEVLHFPVFVTCCSFFSRALRFAVSCICNLLLFFFPGL